MMSMKPGRNDPCPCGSGEKYKRCHGKLEVSSVSQPAQQQAQAVAHGVPSQQEINALVSLFNQQRYIEVELLARSMTEKFPRNWIGWNVLGMVFNLMGRSADALAPLQNAAALSPGNDEVHFNLGITLQNLDRLDEAEASYRRALQIKPNYAEVHINLGNTIKKLGRLDEAENSYRRALQFKPNYAEAHGNLGNTLKELGRLHEAEASYRRALQLKSDYAEVHVNLGVILMEMRRLAEAEASFRRALEIKPDHAMAQHMVASLTGKNTERAPSQYVENLFDGYADMFDTHLQQTLKYEIPEKLLALVTQCSIPPAEKWNVLDLGCGTGLAGSAIAPFAQQLVGVDLSAKMLKKAHARNLYHRLEHSDLLTMMQGENTSSYNVIIAADVFIYLGRLDEIISEIKRLLCPDGIFIFSIEILEVLSNDETGQSTQREYQLENTGRYSHSLDYMGSLAFANDFTVHRTEVAELRMENGKPINGCLMLWTSAR